MATKVKKAKRKYSARESTGINLRTRITSIDSQRVIDLGRETDRNYDFTNPTKAQIELAEYGVAYNASNGLLMPVTGVGEAESLRKMEEARKYLRANAPSRIPSPKY